MAISKGLHIRFVVFSLLAIVLGIPACGGPSAEQESDFQSLLHTLNEMFDLISDIQDSSSIEKNKPRLDDLYAKGKGQVRKIRAIPDKELRTLFEKYKEQVQQVNDKIADQVRRILKGDLPEELVQYLDVVAKSESEGKKEMLLEP